MVKVFNCGAIKVQYKIGRDIIDLWLAVTKNEGGGYCYLLTDSSSDAVDEIIPQYALDHLLHIEITSKQDTSLLHFNSPERCYASF